MEIPPLNDNDLHIWILAIPSDSMTCEDDLPPLRFEDFTAGSLSLSERARAERFHFPADQRRFALCRETLRRLCGAYTGLNPSELEFYGGPNGKPYVKSGLLSESLQFNISHTRGMGVFAFTRVGEIGVDVENVCRKVDALGLGKRVFTSAELETIRPLDEAQQRERFFAYWTAKEAFLKATGVGLSLDPRKIEATLPSSEDSSGKFSAPQGDVETNPWVLRAFRRQDEFQVSLACPEDLPRAGIRVLDYTVED
jgi:4'-phosphopantetheinyl transferase